MEIFCSPILKVPEFSSLKSTGISAALKKLKRGLADEAGCFSYGNIVEFLVDLNALFTAWFNESQVTYQIFDVFYFVDLWFWLVFFRSHQCVWKICIGYRVSIRRLLRLTLDLNTLQLWMSCRSKYNTHSTFISTKLKNMFPFNSIQFNFSWMIDSNLEKLVERG